MIVEDREQPRAKVCARFEAIRGLKCFEIRVLNQVLGVRRVSGQAERRAIQAVDPTQSFALHTFIEHQERPVYSRMFSICPRLATNTGGTFFAGKMPESSPLLR